MPVGLGRRRSTSGGIGAAVRTSLVHALVDRPGQQGDAGGDGRDQ
jgi:hypothetical protein